jgi:hypothetical protein
MVTLNGMDHATNTANFSISKTADIQDLPTTTKCGTGADGSIPPVKAGSTAVLTDGSWAVYQLDGDTDTWIGG